MSKAHDFLLLFAVAFLGACAQGQAPSSAEGSMSRAPSTPGEKACSQPGSEFPANTLRPGEQARTLLQATIGSDGALEGTEVLESSGHARLDELAVKKLSSCRFRAGRDKDGNPVRASFKVEYVWRAQ